MNFKKLIMAVLFPPLAVMIILLPISAVFLVHSMVFVGTKTPVAIVSYVLSAYTLTVWCCKIPDIIKFFKAFGNNNKYAKLWRNDTQLRVNISLYWSLVLNTAYAAFQLGLGLWHRSFWFYSLAAYYVSLAVMRLFLVRHTSKYAIGERQETELSLYRACGVIFLFMNMALSLMIFFMVYWNRTFVHHEITAIAMAAYTFASFTIAIVNTVKYRKLGSPVFSASKAISLASACVSMLTLESTMLTAFGEVTMDMTSRRLLLGITGGVVSVFVIAMAVYMIVCGTKKLNKFKG